MAVKVEETKLFVITSPFDSSNSRSVNIGKNIIVNYSGAISIRGNSLYIKENIITKGYKIVFGCQELTPDKVREIQNFLKNGPTTKKVKGIKKISTDKFTLQELQEEVGNYIITKAGKALSNTEYKVEERLVTIAPLQQAGGYYTLNSHTTMTISRKDDFLKIVNYIVELCDTIDKYLNLK